MAVPWNLVHRLPNMANLPRSLTLSFIGQDQGFKYSMVGGAGSTGMGNTSGVGFDIQTKATALISAAFKVVKVKFISLASAPNVSLSSNA